MDADPNSQNSSGPRLEMSQNKFETSPSRCLSSEQKANEPWSQTITKMKHQSETDSKSGKKSLKRKNNCTSNSTEHSTTIVGLDETKILKTEPQNRALNSAIYSSEEDNSSSSSSDRPNNPVQSTNSESNTKTTKSKAEMIKLSYLSSNEILDTTSDLDDRNQKDGSMGSELIIAAYNNFVRRLVDETLDRSVTFCEQPRHAITALENMCSKAWPNLEFKRHRNRIRAYLKACRRNSKKNRGFINMKEPPANGLSMEAKQMVANALSLVTNEVKQLRKSLNTEDTKIESSSSKAECSLENLYVKSKSSNLSSQDDEKHSYEFLASMDPGFSPTISTNIGEKFRIQKNTWNPVTMLPQDVSRMGNSDLSSVNTNLLQTPNSTIPYFGFDPNYVATLLRLLPNVNQFQETDSFNVTNSFIPNLHFPTNCLAKFNSNNMINELTSDNLNTFDNNCSTNNVLNYERQTYNTPQTDIKQVYDKSHTLDHNNNCMSPATCGQDSGIKWAPPPAHITSPHYSPIMSKAMSKLMDHYALSQEDINFFRQNVEYTKEAIKYARGISRLIMRKIELLENQMQISTNELNLTVINLT